jgi:Putative secretion activating protein
MKTDAQIIDDLIRREGDRFTDHPADRGGPTKYGITQATLLAWRRRTDPAAIVTASDVAALEELEAFAIYRQMFVVDPGFERISDDTLRGFLVDATVQHGPDDVIPWLQAAAGAKVDGKLGPLTAQKVNATNLRALFAELVAVRCSYYGQLVTRDPRLADAKRAGFRLQAENAYGWANRLAEFIRETAVL